MCDYCTEWYHTDWTVLARQSDSMKMLQYKCRLCVSQGINELVYDESLSLYVNIML